MGTKNGVDDTASVILEFGGPIQEISVALCLYGEHLVPDRITEQLGLTPTSSAARGERKGPRSPPLARGVWILERRGFGGDAASLDRLLRKLLEDLSPSDSVWTRIRERFQVELRVALHLGSWNEGTAVEPSTLAAMAHLKIPLLLDVDVDP